MERKVKRWSLKETDNPFLTLKSRIRKNAKFVKVERIFFASQESDKANNWACEKFYLRPEPSGCRNRFCVHPTGICFFSS